MIIAFAAILLAIVFFSSKDDKEAVDPLRDSLRETIDKLADRTDEYYRNTIESRSKVISQNPDVDAYIIRGYAYADLGDYKRALDDFNEAIKLDPLYLYAYYRRGSTYIATGEYNKAIEDFNFIVENSKGQSDRLALYFKLVYDNRGEAYYNLGDYEKALSDFNESFSEYYSARTQDNLIKIYRKLGKDDQAYQLEPKSANDYYKRGASFVMRDYDYKKAVEEIDKGCELDEANTAGCHVARSGLLALLMNFKEASIEARKGFDLSDGKRTNFFQSINWMAKKQR
jgi:tetratricopeptide (TPR) repeat protein